DANKPFLETAPALIAIFLKKFTLDEAGNKHKNYYTAESVGIATGMLITALHNAGVATLTHTPSPMKFLGKILERPDYERPFLLLVCGYPADEIMVPDIQRRELGDIATFI
ncbi:MAG: nitroreductase family protein, partial [Thiolinea sp.]